MEIERFDMFNTVDTLKEQIEALLDLMMLSEDSVDHKSIKTASEMCLNMFDELMVEVEKMEAELREAYQRTRNVAAVEEGKQDVL